MRFLFLCFLLSSCISSYIEKNDQLNFFAEANEDPPYFSELSNWTKEAYVIRDFETRYVVRVTYFAPKFRQEFETRVKRLFLDSNPKFANVAPKMGFFVSIFAPEPPAADIRDRNLWAMLLTSGTNRFTAERVEELSEDKRRWRPFFPYIDKWSREFLVIFDTPTYTPNSDDLVEKIGLSLAFSNADAEVTFVF